MQFSTSVFFATALILLAACETSVEVTDALATDNSAADQESWNVEFSIAEAGVTNLEVRAAYMARFESPDSSYAELSADKNDTSGSSQVRIDLFDAAGTPSAIAQADFVRYDENRIAFEANGRVTVRTPNGKRLECGQLFWDKETRGLRAPGFVRIKTELEEVQGYDLEATESLSSYTIHRITGQVFIDDDF